MQLLHILFTIFLSPPLITAIPSPLSAAHTPHKRGLPGAVYVCNNPKFTGDCGWTFPDNLCHIAGADVGKIQGKPESIGPDPGGYCILYESSTCEGKEVTRISFPGLADNVPMFGGMKCFANEVQPQSPDAPARKGVDGKKERVELLAGGQGSTRNRELAGVIGEMERSGYREGLIGLEKNVYY
ncbi:hypothetical protein BCR34DRAFT_70413 [Clohesyomyces aquaticus]|uniref:Uncharacterized protein n=1 Tax=Clohesyomyces aquaticus TaxID=1231657 RepID=A0A1Y1YZM0_9PLEO|nr:hypothetical protein BCR34DRAFT_70413 [Clohesyomyces aquaticus]